MNSQAYAPERFSPPREGPALLQGIDLPPVRRMESLGRIRQQDDAAGG
jgi:hypothetical protein